MEWPDLEPFDSHDETNWRTRWKLPHLEALSDALRQLREATIMPDIEGVEREVFWATAVDMLNRSVALLHALREGSHEITDHAKAEIEAIQPKLAELVAEPVKK